VSDQCSNTSRCMIVSLKSVNI